MSPNLGWRDEPLGERLAEALGTRRDRDLRQRVGPGGPGRASPWRGHRGRRRRPHLGLDRRRWRADHRWRAARRRRRVRRRGRPHPGQPGRPAMSLRLDRLLGDRGRRATPCCAAPAIRPRPAPRRCTRSSAMPRPARPVALAAFAETGRWLGIGLAGIINVLNPRLVLLGNFLADGYPYIRVGPPGRARPPSPAGVAPDRAGRPDDARRRCPAARRGRAGLRTPAQRPGGVAPAPPSGGRADDCLTIREKEDRPDPERMPRPPA